MSPLYRACLLLVVLACCAAEAHAANLPPVEAFGNLPAASQPELSPDGKFIAVIQSIDGVPAALIYPAGAAKPAIIRPDDWMVVAIRWVKPDCLLLALKVNLRAQGDSELRTWIRYATVKPDGSDFRVLMSKVPAFNFSIQTGGVLDVDLDDPTHIYMPYFVMLGHMEDLRYGVMSVNVETGAASREMVAMPNTFEWFMDGHGHIVARLDKYHQPLTDTLHIYDGTRWTDAGEFDATADRGAHIFGLTGDGKALARRALDTNGMQTMVGRDLVTHRDSTIFSSPEYDVDGAVVDLWTSRIIGGTYIADRPQNFYFDPKNEALQRGLEKAFPDLNVEIESYDLTMNKVVVATEGPKHPTEFYYLDRTTHDAIKIASAYPGLKPSDLGEMKPYPYTARDGLNIPAYITLPPGVSPRNLPAIVLPHGGPDARDYIHFDWWAQFLANRGYVVLQPNYRGSSGYGAKFTAAGLHQWGLKMQDDITDGVKKMIADGIADPKRICIVGASYGGYAALAGATFTPDLYACAVSFAGVSDLRSMLQRARRESGPRSSAVSFWTSRIGDFDDDAEQLTVTSPILHADRVKCPVLLLHGANDTTVPIEESGRMYDALQKAGKQAQFITLDGDDHYFTLAATRIRMLTEVETFLKKNIGN